MFAIRSIQLAQVQSASNLTLKENHVKVLITGGAGYIGSHTVQELLNNQHQVWVLDNLSNGHREAVDERATFIEGSTADAVLLETIFFTFSIEAVIHFAADIEVAESVIDPYKYYHNNFSNALVLLNAMKNCSVRKLVFSSTAAVYGIPESIPIEESQSCYPINPYGRSKLMTEMAIKDFSKAYGLSYAILRYFNVAGACPSAKIGEDHSPETHLIPCILASALRPNAFVKIFGADYPTKDGTCVRDYIHVVDLAWAHVLALDSLQTGHGDIYNIGSENGFSVREVIAACEKVTGKTLSVVEENRRPGDPAILIASSQQIRAKTGWVPKFPQIETIVQHAWNWHQTHPQGYKSLTDRKKSQLIVETSRNFMNV